MRKLQSYFRKNAQVNIGDEGFSKFLSACKRMGYGHLEGQLRAVEDMGRDEAVEAFNGIIGQLDGRLKKVLGRNFGPEWQLIYQNEDDTNFNNALWTNAAILEKFLAAASTTRSAGPGGGEKFGRTRIGKLDGKAVYQNTNSSAYGRLSWEDNSNLGPANTERFWDEKGKKDKHEYGGKGQGELFYYTRGYKGLADDGMTSIASVNHYFTKLAMAINSIGKKKG